MALIATATFDDEDPDLHVHFTGRARQLDGAQPVEWVRVLRTFEDSLTDYARRVATVREQLEVVLTTQAEHKEATRG